MASAETNENRTFRLKQTIKLLKQVYGQKEVHTHIIPLQKAWIPDSDSKAGRNICMGLQELGS